MFHLKMFYYFSSQVLEPKTSDHTPILTEIQTENFDFGCENLGINGNEHEHESDDENEKSINSVRSIEDPVEDWWGLGKPIDGAKQTRKFRSSQSILNPQVGFFNELNSILMFSIC